MENYLKIDFFKNTKDVINTKFVSDIKKNNINPPNKAKSFKKVYFYKKNDNYYQQ